jgi:hypothetical protein
MFEPSSHPDATRRVRWFVALGIVAVAIVSMMIWSRDRGGARRARVGASSASAADPVKPTASRAALAAERDAGSADAGSAADVIGRVSGRVLSPEGTPVAGAQVGASASEAPPRFTSTDGHGRFELAGLSADKVNVFVTAAGFAAEHLWGVTVGSAGLTIVLQPPARVVGKLAYGVRPKDLYVRLCHRDREPSREVCIKSQYYAPPGDSFELDRLPRGDWELVFASSERELVRLPVTIRPGDELELGAVTLR